MFAAAQITQRWIFFKRQSLGAGQERFKDAPVKNEHSHCGDAFGYLMLGGGEQRRLRKARMARLSNRGHILQVASLTCSDEPYTASYV